MYIICFKRILHTCSEKSKKLGKGLFNYDLSSEAKKNTLLQAWKPLKIAFFLPTLFSDNHGQKSWDAFAFLGHFPIHTSPTPPLTPQTTLDIIYQKRMLRVSPGVSNTEKQMLFMCISSINDKRSLLRFQSTMAPINRGWSACAVTWPMASVHIFWAPSPRGGGYIQMFTAHIPEN